MMIDKSAPADYPILEAIKRRWSPRAFADRAVEPERLLSVLEAARWAASSANEQPWRFIVATKDHPEDYARLLGCLKEKNQSWASSAPVLMLTVAKGHFRDDEASENRHAWHDLGLALGNLSIQAAALGLYVHEMASIHPERARERYRIPSGFEPVTALALGYPGEPEALPKDLRRKELAPRRRKPLSELVFSGSWGEPASFASGQNAPEG